MTARGLSASELGRLTATPRGAISYYLMGKSKPRAARLAVLCSVLNIEAPDRKRDRWGVRHEKANTRLYSIWRGVKLRCYCPNHSSYKYYGAKGVEVCEEWRSSFVSFYEWAMLHGYRDDLTLDRVDPYGNYEPDNCRWATWKEQAQNKRRQNGQSMENSRGLPLQNPNTERLHHRDTSART